MPPVILSYQDLATRGIRFSKMHLRRLERAAKFPQRVTISAQRVGWLESEIDEWLAARVAARDCSIAA